MFAAGGLQFAGRTNPVVVAVKPDFQEQARMVGWAAFHGGGHGEPQRGQIQLVHKLAQETGRVVGAYPIFQRGGKEKLLTVIGCDGLCHAAQTPTTVIHSKNAGVLGQSPLRRLNFHKTSKAMFFACSIAGPATKAKQQLCPTTVRGSRCARSRTNQKGLTGHGRGASCPRSQDNAGTDKAFGLSLFPAKTSNDTVTLSE